MMCETAERLDTKEQQKLKKILTVLEIGSKLQVIRWDSDTWAVCLLVLFEGNEDPFFVKVHDQQVYAFRLYLSREEARYGRDVIQSAMARNPAQEVFLGVEGDDKQVISFKPSDFEVQFTVPKSLQTFGRKRKTKAAARRSVV